MSMIAAGKGQRYEWSAGRNVQFTAVWDFHLSSAQWRRAGEGEKRGARRERSEERGFLSPSCSTSWTEYQLERALECVRRSRSYQSPWMFHIFLSRSRILYVLSSPLLINREVQYLRLVLALLAPTPPFLSCSIRMHLPNIHHWASLLCLRPDGIHPNICMPSNLQEEWNNPAKTNQSFIKTAPLDQSAALPEPLVVVRAEVKTYGRDTSRSRRS